MKRIILTLIVTFGLTNLVNAQEFEWGYKVDKGFVLKTTTDVNNNTYVLIKTQSITVSLNGTNYSFSSTMPSNYTNYETFLNYSIFKFNSNGSLVLKTNFAFNTSEDIADGYYVTEFSTDIDGNIYIKGDLMDITHECELYISESSSSYEYFDSKTSSQLGKNILSIKLNSSGRYEWIKNNSGSNYGDNRFLYASKLSESVYIVEGDGPDIYKFDKDGNQLFKSTSPESGENHAKVQDILESADGKYFYVVSRGAYQHKTPYGFYTKFDATTGTYIQTYPVNNFHTLSSTATPGGWNGAIDDDKNLYICGFSLQTDSLFSHAVDVNKDGFLVKLDSSNNIKWFIETDFDLTLFDVVISNNHLFIIGNYFSDGNFGEYTFTGKGTFYAEIDLDGNIILAESYPNVTYTKEAALSSDELFTAFKDGTSVKINGVTYNMTGKHYFGKLKSSVNIIKGTVYYDLNNNSTQDVNELGAVNFPISVNNKNLITGVSGSYTSRADSGTFIVTTDSVRYYNIAPIKDSIEFSTIDSTAVNRNFRLVPVGNINDLEVYLTNVTPSRPGFNVIYRLTAKNVGTTVLNSTVKLTYDSLLTFQNAGPPETTDTYPEITWDVANLKPGEVKNFTVRFTLPPPAANFGDTLCNLVEITPITNDTTDGNNKDTLYQRVTGAYDPNIKETNKPEVLNVDDINGSFAIDYTIHFQNTGNDTAFHVYLIDSLDEDLKVETIEVLSASHDYEMSISENNTLRWDYYNILLVDSNTNEPQSHGFVKYRVWTKDNPGLGDEFTNFADIYFDFNEPVRTNTTTNRIDKVESVELVKGTTVIVYPNPSNGIFAVKANIKAGTKTKLEVLDLTGKIIYTENTKATTNGLEAKIDINTIPQGIYFIKVYAGNEAFTAKIIKQ